MTKYKHATPGQWDLIELEMTYKVQCCDCGLVHDYEYKRMNGKFFVRAQRNERSTAQVRRHKKMEQAPIVQLRNPRTGKYIMVDRVDGKIIGSQKTRYKNVPFIK